MSAENVEIVRTFAEGMMNGDFERVSELVDPEVEGHGTVGGLEEGRVYRGMDALVHQFATDDAEAWEERRFEATDFLPFGDRVLVLIHEYRRGKGSGVELENDTAMVVTVGNGRIMRIAGYMDQDAARAAAGLAD